MTILETTPIMECIRDFSWMIFVGAIIIILGLIIAKIFFEEGFPTAEGICYFIALLGLVLIIVGIVLEINEPKVDTGRTKYIIKCDDSISLNDFYNKYKILEHAQYTDVYVVEEIKNDD